jgi:hypothetical protein
VNRAFAPKTVTWNANEFLNTKSRISKGRPEISEQSWIVVSWTTLLRSEILPPANVSRDSRLSRWHERISISDRKVSVTPRLCRNGVWKLMNVKLKK